MKKQIILLLILMSISFNSTNAQITIRKKNVIERPVVKPKQFDSLSNIIMQEKPIDYKKYIGYKLFFLPKSKKYKSKYDSDNKERIIDFLFSNDTIQIVKKGKIPFEQTVDGKFYGDVSKLKGKALEQYKKEKKEYENIDKEKTNIYLPHFFYDRTDKTDGTIYGKIGSFPDSIYGKYFTIIDIKGRKYYKSNEFQKLEDLDLEGQEYYSLRLKIFLRNESNKDTLYWLVEQASTIGKPFFLVPYFNKLQKKFLNKKLLLRYKNKTNPKLKNLIDVNTGEFIKIKYGELWTCSDISFIDSKDSYYLKGFFFLTNGKNEIKISIDSDLIDNYFILQSEFKKQEAERKKKEEEKRIAEEERQKKLEKEKLEFKRYCINKWGQKLGNYIANGKVILGMNKEMCITAWGEPISKNRTIVRGLTSEQWVYGWGTYLYFDNGKLTAIQD